MKNLFVPYEISLKAKEKGFNEPCLMFYSYQKELTESSILHEKPHFNSKFLDLCTAPIYQQLTDWLREIHQIHLTINPTNFSIAGANFGTIKSAHFEFKKYYDSYNKAIDEALNLI